MVGLGRPSFILMRSILRRAKCYSEEQNATYNTIIARTTSKKDTKSIPPILIAIEEIEYR